MSIVPIKTVIDLPLSALDISQTPVMTNGIVNPMINLTDSTLISVPGYKNMKVVIMFTFSECYWCKMVMPEYEKAAASNNDPTIVYTRFNVIVSGSYEDGNSVWWNAFGTDKYSDSDFCKLLWSMQGTPTWVGYLNGKYDSTLNETGLEGASDGSDRVEALFTNFAKSIGTVQQIKKENFMFSRTRTLPPKESYRRRVKGAGNTSTKVKGQEFYTQQTQQAYKVSDDYLSDNKYTKMPAFWIIGISILLLWAIIFLLGRHSKTCKGIHSSVKKMFIL